MGEEQTSISKNKRKQHKFSERTLAAIELSERAPAKNEVKGKIVG